MTSSPSGDMRIGTAIDLIQDVFARQCRTKTTPTLRFSLEIADEKILLDAPGDATANN